MQHQHGGREQLQLWYCADCSGVHLRTGHVSLTFNHEEFAELSRAVIDIYQSDAAFQPEENAGQIEQDEVLESDLIV
jgi:hypothetical protein